MTTTFRWLTPAAPAALAVVRLESRDAWPDTTPLCDRPLPPVGRVRFTRLHDRHGATVDEVIIARLSPHCLDIATHGGIGIRANVEAALIDHGLTISTTANTPPSPRGEASPAVRLGHWWSRLAHSPAPAPTRWLMQAAAKAGRTDPPFPVHFLSRPPVVLITGATNAGKSTLINAWCGRPRALVSALPGTTRDLLAAEALCAGWRLHLLDSAGLRADPGDPLEGAGQTLAIAARAHADVILHLRSPGDSGDPIPNALVVQGKADLIPPANRDPTLPQWSAHGLPGRSPADLIDALGHAVLAHLGLPPETNLMTNLEPAQKNPNISQPVTSHVRT